MSVPPSEEVKQAFARDRVVVEARWCWSGVDGAGMPALVVVTAGAGAFSLFWPAPILGEAVGVILDWLEGRAARLPDPDEL